MKKQYLIAILLVGIIIFILFYTFSLQPLISNAIFKQQNQENKTEPFKFPFKLPWQTTETTSNTTTGTIGSNATAGGGSGVGGSGIEIPNKMQLDIYVLNLYSVPEGLPITTKFYFNKVINLTTANPPYYLEIDKNSTACVLPAYKPTDVGGLTWLLDGEICSFSQCEDYLYGCTINMDSNHSITLLHVT